MSLDYYYRSLRYADKRGGIAKEGDLELKIHAPPIVLPGAVEISFGEVEKGELAYVPYIVRRDGGAKEDLTAPEIIVVRRWLFNLLASVLRAATADVPLEGERRKVPR